MDMSRLKRLHKKSRHGCDQCRKRRVKCDETRPSCAACTLWSADCHYSQSQKSNSRAGVSSSLSSQISWPELHQVADPLNDIRCTTRRTELALMHVWLTKTCQSFTGRLTDLLRGQVVTDALEHDYLLDFIFTLTSLHIAKETTDPIVAASHVSTALQYQNTGFFKFRNALNDVTESNCGALFVSSILALACSWVLPLFLDRDRERDNSLTKSILRLKGFRFGIISIVVRSHHWLQSGPYRVALDFRSRSAKPRPADRTCLPIERLRRLEENMSSTFCLNQHQVYENAIGHLEECFLGDQTLALTWLTMAGKEFTKLLETEEPMALMILTYWGVLLDKLDEMWWAKISGKRLVEEVCENLSGHGDQWDEAKQWAQAEVSAIVT